MPVEQLTRGSLTQPHLEWWGLRTGPFQLEPDPAFLVERNDHREALARVLFGLTQLGGIVMITGQIGCGKTMLARALHRVLGENEFAQVTVANPPRTASGVMAALVASLSPTSRGGTTAKMAGELRARCDEFAAQGRRPVLVVDEAQRLDARALDELRMLTNPGEAPGIPVILLGQPELADRVRAIPQVAQRVVVSYHLTGMDPHEVAMYVQHRSQAAGATRRLFTSRAEAAIHAQTAGIPRLVNLLCANALFVGFVRRETQIGEDLIRDLADDRNSLTGEQLP